MDFYNDVYDQYDYGSPYLETTLIGMMMICFIIMLVCAIFALASYILKGIGMYTMAKRQGMDYAWLAFIPFARTYLHGELAGSIRLKNKSIQNPGIWLLALPFLYGAVSSLLNGIMWFVGVGSLTKIIQSTYLPYGRVDLSGGAVMGLVVLLLIYIVISLGYTAVYKSFGILVDHQILERFTTKNMSIVHAVLGTLIPLYESICFFVMRNRPFNPGMEPPAPQPFMQSPPPGAYYGGPVPPPEPPVPPVPPMTGNDSTPTGASGFGSYGNSFGASENTSGTPDFGSFGDGGSILGDPGTGNSSIFSGPSILNDASDGQEAPLGEDAAPSAGTDASADSSAGSPVNFILPENENKES